VTARALERIPLNTAFQRFAVGALTRAVPLLVLCLILQLLGPGIAFAGMMLGILALVFILMSAIHALATRGAGDYRSGAVACGIVLAWITAFWIPLFWV
jgi:multisubunit Na+/H+ antiporter MnhB subunit